MCEGYLRFKLSPRDLVEMMAERALSLSHMTIMRWVQCYAQEFVKTLESLRPSHGSILARRPDLCEALRPMGVSLPGCGLPTRRQASCRCRQGLLQEGEQSKGRPPQTITLDGYASSHRAVREMKADAVLPEDMTLRSSKYLNNLIEQDHRNIKARVAVMLGFKRFKSAAIIIAGLELMHRIRKGQFNLAARLKEAAAPAVWNAMLSA